MNDKLQQLIGYASSENWEAMDALIPKVCDDSEIITWSLQTGVNDQDGNVRDLAVSLLEKSHYQLKPEDIQMLEEKLKSDGNNYVQFRAAFTLFNREIKSEEVMKKMDEALLDEDVKGIASKYLGGEL